MPKGFPLPLKGTSPQEFAKQLKASIREGLKSLNLNPKIMKKPRLTRKSLYLNCSGNGRGKGIDYSAFVDAAVSRGIPRSWWKKSSALFLQGAVLRAENRYHKACRLTWRKTLQALEVKNSGLKTCDNAYVIKLIGIFVKI